MKKRRRPLSLPAPSASDSFLVTMPPSTVGMFRFLLEGYDNIASFTVLDRHEALLKVFFSPHQQAQARAALDGIAHTVPLMFRATPEDATPNTGESLSSENTPNG